MMKSRVVFDLYTNLATSVALSPCGNYVAYLNYKHKIVNIVDVVISQITHQIELSELPAPGKNKTLFWVGRCIVVITHTGQGFVVYDSQDGYRLVADVHIGTGKLIEDVSPNPERECILLTTFDIGGPNANNLTELFEYSLATGKLLSSCSESGVHFHSCDYASRGILALASMADVHGEQKWHIVRLNDELMIDHSHTEPLNADFDLVTSRKQRIRCVDIDGSEKYVLVIGNRGHNEDIGQGFGYFISDSRVDDGKLDLKVWINGFEKLIKVKDRFYILESVDGSGDIYGLTDVEYEENENGDDPDSSEYLYKSSSVIFDLDTNGRDVVLCGDKITLLRAVDYL